ncbi:hypothetical protein MKZ38_004388 [Zalerion maritima]|uniref:Uncharacterized protein n=1 Tax=Zalerion maritima TaxID=339359 RepID=A0AAD5RLI9_9PEZI|nr:hypothetical protein MKZ38_004388 [Zalerion maritima]
MYRTSSRPSPNPQGFLCKEAVSALEPIDQYSTLQEMSRATPSHGHRPVSLASNDEDDVDDQTDEDADNQTDEGADTPDQRGSLQMQLLVNMLARYTRLKELKWGDAIEVHSGHPDIYNAWLNDKLTLGLVQECLSREEASTTGVSKTPPIKTTAVWPLFSNAYLRLSRQLRNDILDNLWPQERRVDLSGFPYDIFTAEDSTSQHGASSRALAGSIERHLYGIADEVIRVMVWDLDLLTDGKMTSFPRSSNRMGTELERPSKRQRTGDEQERPSERPGEDELSPTTEIITTDDPGLEGGAASAVRRPSGTRKKRTPKGRVLSQFSHPAGEIYTPTHDDNNNASTSLARRVKTPRYSHDPAYASLRHDRADKSRGQENMTVGSDEGTSLAAMAHSYQPTLDPDASAAQPAEDTALPSRIIGTGRSLRLRTGGEQERPSERPEEDEPNTTTEIITTNEGPGWDDASPSPTSDPYESDDGSGTSLASGVETPRSAHGKVWRGARRVKPKGHENIATIEEGLDEIRQRLHERVDSCVEKLNEELKGKRKAQEDMKRAEKSLEEARRDVRRKRQELKQKQEEVKQKQEELRSAKQAKNEQDAQLAGARDLFEEKCRTAASAYAAIQLE